MVFFTITQLTYFQCRSVAKFCFHKNYISNPFYLEDVIVLSLLIIVVAPSINVTAKITFLDPKDLCDNFVPEDIQGLLVLIENSNSL